MVGATAIGLLLGILVAFWRRRHTKGEAETLRAQAHEFANKLHTIAGLLELGRYDKAVAFIAETTREQQEWIDERLHQGPTGCYTGS